MKKLMLSFAVVFLGYSAFAQNTANLLSNYLSVKGALVNGDSKTAFAAASSLHKAVKNEDDFALKPDLLKATEKLSKADKNIDRQRAAFNDVSVIMWKLSKSDDNIDYPVYYQYCPMKKAYWLSKDNDIENPYFGSAMLNCGKVEDIKR